MDGNHPNAGMRGLGTARNTLNKLTKVFERSLLCGCHHAFQHVPSLVKELYQWTVGVTQEVATSLANPCQIFSSCDANCFCKLHAAINETLSLQLRISTLPTDMFNKHSPRSLDHVPLTLEKLQHLCLRKVGLPGFELDEEEGHHCLLAYPGSDTIRILETVC